MIVYFLAHDGHSHGPGLGLIALLAAGAVLAVLLLLPLLNRARRRSPERRS
jgi:hypothetical protein